MSRNIPPMTLPVYSPLAGLPFRRWFQEELEALARSVESALGPRLVALILGGGYGRDEGAVVGPPSAQRPYNDLDLVIITRDRGSLAVLEPARRLHQERLGVEIDFNRPLTLEDVRRWSHRLMWDDLLRGHHVLRGDPRVLTGLDIPWRGHPLPPVEASRLLLNRGAGLLWASSVLAGRTDAPDPDFVRRNIQKARLALGDALLMLSGDHGLPLWARGPRLRRLAGRPDGGPAAELIEDYTQALLFKIAPAEIVMGPLERELARTRAHWGRVFLWVERRRLDLPVSDLEEYHAWRGLREPEEHVGTRWLRNLWVNLRHAALSWLYPRERLYRELPALLGLAGPPGTDSRAGTEAFLRTWRSFN